MTDGKSIRTLVGYQLDVASQKQILDSNKTVIASLQSIASATNAINTPSVAKLENSFAGLTPRVAAARAEISDIRQVLAAYGGNIELADKTTVSWIGDLQKLRSEIKGVKEDSAGGVGNLGGDTGGGRGSGLRALGAAGRQLPSIQLAGGITSDAASNILRIAGSIGELSEKAGISVTALAGAGIAVGVLAAGLVILTTNAKAAAEAAKADLDARARAITLLQQGTKEEIQARINELQAKRDINEQIKKDADTLVDQLRQNNIKTLGGGEALRAEIASVLGTGAGELTGAKNNAAAAAKALGETNVELVLLAQQSGLAAQSASDLARKEGELAAERYRILFTTDDIQNKLNADIEAYNLAQNGTSKSLTDRKNQLATEIQSTDNAIAMAQHKLETDKLSAAEQENLRTVIGGLVEKSNALKTSLNFISQAFVDTSIKAREAADAQEKILAAQSASALKFAAEITKLNQDKDSAQIKAADDLLNKITSISQAAVDNSVKILEGLQTKSAELERNLGRALQTDAEKQSFDRLQNQIHFAQNELAEERKTRQEIAKIKQDGADREFDLQLDRNFSGIAANRRAVAQAVVAAQQQATNEKEARLIRYQQSQADDDANFQFQRAQKVKQEQLAIADAQEAANRALKAADANRTKQLNLAQAQYNKELAQINAKYANELQQRRAAEIAELNLIAQGEQGKAQVLQQGVNQAKLILSGLFDGLGGSSGAGGTSNVPTPSIRGAGGLRVGAFPTRTPLFSGGSSSSVSNTGITLNQVNNFTGADPQKLLPAIEKRTRDILADSIEKMNRR